MKCDENGVITLHLRYVKEILKLIELFFVAVNQVTMGVKDSKFICLVNYRPNKVMCKKKDVSGCVEPQHMYIYT